MKMFRSSCIAISGLAALSTAAFAQPANDLPENATDLSSQTFPYVTPVTATALANFAPEFTVCVTSNSSIWYKALATTSGSGAIATCAADAPETNISDTVVSVFASADGTANTLTQIACNDDSCGLRSLTTFTGTAGTTYYFQIAKYGTAAPVAGTDNLQARITMPTPPPPGTFVESTDAGELLTTATVISTPGNIPSIQGSTSVGDPADMYRVQICDAANFTATLVNGATFDTQLSVYDSTGIGIAFNDDASITGTIIRQSRIDTGVISTPGVYYIAITGFDYDAVDELGNELWTDLPYDTTRAPNGPGAASTISGWASAFAPVSGAYTLRLTGACGVTSGPTCGSADFNGDGDVGTDADIEAFFSCLAGNCCTTCGTADFNGDGDVGTDADIEAFFRVLAGGNC